MIHVLFLDHPACFQVFYIYCLVSIWQGGAILWLAQNWVGCVCIVGSVHSQVNPLFSQPGPNNIWVVCLSWLTLVTKHCLHEIHSIVADEIRKTNLLFSFQKNKELSDKKGCHTGIIINDSEYLNIF